jgi:hypothetical protein
LPLNLSPNLCGSFLSDFISIFESAIDLELNVVAGLIYWLFVGDESKEFVNDELSAVDLRSMDSVREVWVWRRNSWS